jgi:CelD/BcsL family acetyltransferase involved in cellulose biosynthesis
MLTVAEVNQPDQLASFSLVWQTLWDRTPQRSFFQTRDWLECYCRHFGADRKLRVLMVLSATRPIGIVPLVIKRAATALGTLRVLTYPLDGWGPFFGPIGSDPTATLFGALKHLAETPRDWDLLDLRSVDDERVDKGRTANAFQLAGLPATQRLWERNLEVPVAHWSTGDQFHFRRRMKEAEKQLGERGGWEFIRLRIVAPDPEQATECRFLAAEARAMLVSTGMSFPWFSDVVEAALCAGVADVCQLRVNGRLAAAAFNTVADETVQPLAIVFSPEIGPAARTVLMGRMLFDGLDRGDTTYLFGRRTAEWAEEWRPNLRPSERFTHFAGYRPRAQILRLNELRKRWWRGAAQTA